MTATTKTKTAGPVADATTIDNAALKANQKRIGARITANYASLKKSHAETHEIAMEVLQHVETFRECSLATRTITEMPGGGRKNALIAWYQAHGKMKWSNEKKAFIFKKDFATKLEEARAKPYWEFVPEKEFEAYDLEKDIAKLIKRAAARAEEDERNHVNPVLLAKLQAITNSNNKVIDNVQPENTEAA